MDFPKVLRPGQVGKIKIKVETGKAPGPHTKSVTIISDDPAQKTAMFQFTFDVVDK
ncbi:MAG: hypothetical protein AB1757_07830 [Acidobacteriota bacterium]